MKNTENQMISYTVVVEKSDTGFSALVDELPVYTTGANLQEIEDNIQEALRLYLTESSKFEIKLVVSPESEGKKSEVRRQ